MLARCSLVTTVISIAISATVALAVSAGQTTDRLPERFEFTQIQMGMPFKVVLYAPDEDSANAAARAAYARIKQLNGIMSDYDPESELTRLCHTAGTGKEVRVSRDLLAVLSHSLELSKKSDGSFDVTVGPVVKLWRKARRAKNLPDPAELAAARELVGYRNVRIDERAGTVELLKKGMQLDLGGIAVGYAIDDVLQLLKDRGITSALVDGSGDIGVSDAPPGKAGWRIGIAPLDADEEPGRYVILKNAAVTTSGDAFQFVEFDGKRYSHIVDPRTGLGLVDHSSVTVLARNCTIADSYTKAVSVLGPKKGLALIDDTPGAAAIVVQGTMETFESKRVREFTFQDANPEPTGVPRPE